MTKMPKPPTYVKKGQSPKKQKGQLYPKAFARWEAFM